MSDPLYNRITEGLESLGNGEKFEACANSLLREKYPYLTWIKGGDDAGFDGAGILSDGTRVQLICTTDDNVIGNVTHSLDRAKEENQESDLVLVATSRRLSPERKRNIQERISEKGKKPMEIEDQPVFAELIYHSPRWRKELLEIPGHPPPLSLYPQTDRVFLSIPPIGRDAEIARLEANDRDLVVFGQPGAGKTHLLANVASKTDGLFLVSEVEEAIMDGIREQQPKWIIVDDAMARLELLAKLRQMRKDTDANFRIVAACWPGQEEDVAAALDTTGLEALEVGPLLQIEIKKIINAAGVGGPDELLSELIAQANGKPGLAVTLARLCFREKIRDVFTGKALASDVKRSLTEMSGKEAVGLLGYFALAGDAGLRLSTAAQLSEAKQDTARQQADSMGAAGVLHVLDNKNLAVEPIRLRQALVAEMFGKPGFALEWEPLLPAMPQVADALTTLIGAKAVGGQIDDGRLQEQIDLLARNGSGAKEACVCYAQLGRTQSLWVLERFPGILDAVADHVLEHAPREALPLLIRADLKNPQENRSNERLKQVAKWLNEVAMEPETVNRRQLVMDILLAMEPEIRDTPTLLAALAHVFSLRFERTLRPPGELMRLVFQHGPIPLDSAERVADLWKAAFPLLDKLSTKQTGQLISVIEDWVIPQRISDRLPEGYAEACKRHGRTMLADIIEAYAGRWAVLRRFQHLAESLGVEIPDEAPPLVATLYPARVSAFDVEERPEHRDAAIALAQQWMDAESIAKVIGDWLTCEREAHENGLGYRELSEIVAYEIASKSRDVRAWLREMCAQRAPWSLVWPFAWNVCNQDGAAVDEFVALYRDDHDYGRLAAELLLLLSRPGIPIWDSSREALMTHSGRIGTAVLCNKLEDTTIGWFLENGTPAVVREVASHLWTAEPRGVIPEPLQALWRKAVVDHLAEDHEWEGIAQRHPELACAWLKQRINQTYEERHQAESDFTANHYLPIIIGALTKEQRRELIDHIAVDNCRYDVLVSIVGGDLDLMRHALARPATTRMARQCLGTPEGNPDRWAERAILFFEHGMTAQEVSVASQSVAIGGAGKFSEHFEKRRLAYAALSNHTDARVREVCALANATLIAYRDDERKRERRAAIRGELF